MGNRVTVGNAVMIGVFSTLLSTSGEGCEESGTTEVDAGALHAARNVNVTKIRKHRWKTLTDDIQSFVLYISFITLKYSSMDSSPIALRRSFTWSSFSIGYGTITPSS